MFLKVTKVTNAVYYLTFLLRTFVLEFNSKIKLEGSADLTLEQYYKF